MRSRFITVTAINVLTMANDLILKNRRRGFDAELELPPLRERAALMVAENNVLTVTEDEDEATLALMR